MLVIRIHRVSSGPGPLLDRIDIRIEVPRVDCEQLSADRMGAGRSAVDAGSNDATQFFGVGISPIMKLASTIADLAGSEETQSIDLAEALQYRPKLMLN